MTFCSSKFACVNLLVVIVAHSHQRPPPTNPSCVHLQPPLFSPHVTTIPFHLTTPLPRRSRHADILPHRTILGHRPWCLALTRRRPPMTNAIHSLLVMILHVLSIILFVAFARSTCPIMGYRFPSSRLTFLGIYPNPNSLISLLG